MSEFTVVSSKMHMLSLLKVTGSALSFQITAQMGQAETDSMNVWQQWGYRVPNTSIYNMGCVQMQFYCLRIWRLGDIRCRVTLGMWLQKERGCWTPHVYRPMFLTSCESQFPDTVSTMSDVIYS
jgi:hypothetical protein